MWWQFSTSSNHHFSPIWGNPYIIDGGATVKGDNEIGAIFSDRRSANNFKTILKKVLTNEIKVYTGYKDEDDGSYMTNSEAILDRIPKLIPTIDISDVEIILDAFKNINTNSLYADDPNDALKRISS